MKFFNKILLGLSLGASAVAFGQKIYKIDGQNVNGATPSLVSYVGERIYWVIDAVNSEGKVTTFNDDPFSGLSFRTDTTTSNAAAGVNTLPKCLSEYSSDNIQNKKGYIGSAELDYSNQTKKFFIGGIPTEVTSAQGKYVTITAVESSLWGGNKSATVHYYHIVKSRNVKITSDLNIPEGTSPINVSVQIDANKIYNVKLKIEKPDGSVSYTSVIQSKGDGTNSNATFAITDKLPSGTKIFPILVFGNDAQCGVAGKDMPISTQPPAPVTITPAANKELPAYINPHLISFPK